MTVHASAKVPFFTCKLNYAGIGDQLFQLRTLYRIGRSFNLTYVHTPIDNRWCPGLDINRFLGLDLGEKRIEDFRGYRLLDVPYRVVLDHLHRRQPLEAFFSPDTLQSPTILRLCSAQEIYSTQPDDTAVDPNICFDLSRKFAAAHEGDDLSPFRTNRIRIALHIRRGDCCWIEHDGKIVFPYRNKEVLKGAPDVDSERALPMSYYTSVLNAIFSTYPPAECEVRVYSDGYGNVLWGPLQLKDLIRHGLGLMYRCLHVRSRMIPRVGIFEGRIWRKMKELRREFDILRDYPTEIEFRVGQSVQLTKETICAFGYADVIVVARRGAFPDLGLRLNRSQRTISPGNDVFSALRQLR